MSSPDAKIPRGYYIKARKIEDSQIAHSPPHVREIWDLLIRDANHKDRKCGDTIIRRGQILTSYKDIRERLHWKIGWRKKTYSKWQCESTMKQLKSATMITTKKTTRGIIISIVNYDYYQNPENYENHKKADMKATIKPQNTDTTNNKGKNCKNGKKGNIKEFTSDSIEYGLAKHLFDSIRSFKEDFKKPNLQTWAKHIDYMLRLDERNPERIEAVINWCTRNDFWKSNILSTEKLRQQFDRLEIEMDKSNERKGFQKTKRTASKEASQDSQTTRKAISEQDFGCCGQMFNTEE